uniref:F-box domain-containing protein n=1 Tax=Fagus sylvatica TaxID=28930 RepID=A0A2N9GQV7_FAGSY
MRGRRSKKRGRGRTKKQEEGEVEASGGRDYISELPQTIVIDILTRLPFKTIFSCRCVSKTWLSLVLDPSFSQIYHRRITTGPHPCTSIIIQPLYDPNKVELLYALDLDKNHNNQLSVTHYSATVKFDTKTHLGFDGLEHNLLDSCNGLILLGAVNDRVYVCNPIIGEYVIVRTPKKIPPQSVCSRLGFCPKTQVYKVLLFPRTDFERYQDTPTYVYTLGLEQGHWRSVKVDHNLYLTGCVRYGVYLNGFIHWVVTSPDVPHYIHSFDVGNECFKLVPPPPELELPEKYMGPKPEMNLGVLRGCLAYGEFPLDDIWNLHIWVMKEYGVQASWTKEYTIKNNLTQEYWFSPPVPCLQMLGLCNNGDILMTFQRERLVSFNPVNQRYRFHRVDGINFLDALPYIPCFSSLKDIAKGELVLNARSR